MFTTRIRAGGIALAAAFTLAIATGPIAQAAPKGGGGTNKMSKQACQDLKDQANTDSDAAAEAYEAGDIAAGNKLSYLADLDYDTARRGGCSWATRVAAPPGLGQTGTLATFGG